jgi:hypothetical protein
MNSYWLDRETARETVVHIIDTKENSWVKCNEPNVQARLPTICKIGIK